MNAQNERAKATQAQKGGKGRGSWIASPAASVLKLFSLVCGHHKLCMHKSQLVNWDTKLRLFMRLVKYLDKTQLAKNEE